MREIKGYIVLHKKLLDWQWYDEINTKVLFIHCLLMANYEPNEWRGIIINRGQFITSVNGLSEQTGLSTQKIRTSLKNLISTKEITSKSTNKYTTLTICKYDSYQKIEKQNNKQKTIEKQTKNKQITTTKEDKELKETNKYIFMLKIGKLFKRMETTEWSEKEKRKLNEIIKRKNSLDELELIVWHYGSGYLYLRKNIITFLNNWTGELDKANNNNKQGVKNYGI